MDIELKTVSCKRCGGALFASAEQKEVVGKMEIDIDVYCSECGSWDAYDLELEEFLADHLTLVDDRQPIQHGGESHGVSEQEWGRANRKNDLAREG